MAIKGLVVGGIDTAFKVLKELVQEVTITDPSVEYDPTTGTTEEASTFTCDVLFGGTIEKDGEVVKQGDREAYLKVADVLAANNGNELRAQMTLLDSKGGQWLFVSVTIDATETVYTCAIRKTR